MGQPPLNIPVAAVESLRSDAPVLLRLLEEESIRAAGCSGCAVPDGAHLRECLLGGGFRRGSSLLHRGGWLPRVGSPQDLPHELRKGGSHKHMSSRVYIQNRIRRRTEHGVCRKNLSKGAPGNPNGESSRGPFLLPDFHDEGAWSDTGEDVGEIELLFQPREIPAGAVAILHVRHRGQPSAAAGGPDPLIQRGHIHGGLPSKRKPRNGKPVGVHLGPGLQVIKAPERIPDPLPHQRPLGMLQLVLADIRGNDSTPHPRQCRSIPVKALPVHHLAAGAPVPGDGQHGPHPAFPVQRHHHPGMGTAVRQALKSHLLKLIPRLRAWDALEHFGIQWHPGGHCPSHQSVEQFLAGVPLPESGLSRGGGRKPVGASRIARREPAGRKEQKRKNQRFHISGCPIILVSQPTDKAILRWDPCT